MSVFNLLKFDKNVLFFIRQTKRWRSFEGRKQGGDGGNGGSPVYRLVSRVGGGVREGGACRDRVPTKERQMDRSARGEESIDGGRIVSEASCQKHGPIMQIQGRDGQWTPNQVQGRTINNRSPEGPILVVLLLPAVGMFT